MADDVSGEWGFRSIAFTLCTVGLLIIGLAIDGCYRLLS